MFAFGSLRSAGDNKEKTIRVAEERLKILARHALEKVEVDEKWYLETYPDIKSGIDNRHIRSARDHYIEFGYFEDRCPRPIKVDEAWYLKTYPDVAKDVREKKLASAQEHFALHGFREGRMPYPGWSLLSDAGGKPVPASINRVGPSIETSSG